MAKPRVLLVDHSAEVSGAEQSMLELLAVVDASHWEPVVACPPQGGLARALEKSGTPVFPVQPGRLTRSRDPRVRLRQTTLFLKGVRELRTVLRHVRPDIIHANTTMAALSAALAVRSTSTPLVWHVRDLVRLGFTGRRLYRRSRAVIAISHAVADTVLPEKEPTGKVRVIHNGIDADAFLARIDGADLRPGLHLPTDARIVVTVAQLTRWKGHDVLLESWAKVTRRLGNVILLLVGTAMWPEDAGWEAELKSRADRLGLGGSVRFLGRREDVGRILNTCTCLAVPSRAEPFGRAALEAMVLGKPVVGTAAGGLVEVVEPGVTGILVKPDDADALAEALVRILSEPETARNMGQAGSERVRKNFDTRETARLTQGIWEDVLRA